MIIWGTTGRSSRLESGTFHCPRCGNDKPFDIVGVHRWFTLYFIPVIPLGEAGRYLECKNCSATFDEAVRHHDPEVESAKLRASFEGTMLRAMLVMAQADGVVEDRELDAVADIMTQLTGNAYEVEEVRAALDACGHPSMESVLASIAGSLNDNGKGMVLKGLVMIASIDGHLAEGEKETLYSAGKAMGIRRKDIAGILASMEKITTVEN